MKIGKKFLAYLLAAAIVCTMLPIVTGLISIAESTSTPAVFQETFLNSDGTFNTAAEGFPANYEFDFTATTTSTFKMVVSKKFFHAVKQSGRTVTLVDNIGVKYLFAADDIVNISSDVFAETVFVGGRYRDTSSYVTVAKKIALDNMQIPNDQYNHKVDFGFLEVETGNGIALNCEIRFAMNFGVASDTATALHFYNLASNNSLYVYQYSSSALTTRAVAKAVAKTSPEISTFKSEAGSMQLLFSDCPLRASDVETTPTESTGTTATTTGSSSTTATTTTTAATTTTTTTATTTAPAQPVAADYSESFVQNGQFVTTAAGFPSSYIFKFGTYSASNQGFKKDLFQAIKNSGRIVTLIDRYNISYVFDGRTMSDIPQSTRDELFQLQSLYKTSSSYQTVMGKIAGLSNITDGFFMNQDYIILDIQPTSSVGVTVNNTFPTPAKIVLTLNNGVSGTAGTEIAERFAQYARDGLLKAYFYDKTTEVQDLFEDKAPLVPAVTNDGQITFTVTDPCVLIFSQKDLLTGRQGEVVNTNPYEMRIKKDGKNMSDGYTMELGEEQLFDLTMSNGNIRDYTYTWDVIGPGADSVTITEAPNSDGLTYVVKAVKESEASKPFQVRVRIAGETNNFVTTGTITVIDSVFGKSMIQDGKFNTQAEGFPQNYIFEMDSKYQITGQFLNAIAASKKDVTLVDSSKIQYLFHGEDMDAVPQEDWAITYPVKALYKDATSYQNVMLSIAYQNGYTSFENNKDYIIIDFQAHGADLPVDVDTTFRLEGKVFDSAVADHFAKLYREGKFYVYAYSKTSQNVYKPFDGVTLIEDTNYFTMRLQSPVTLVFSAVPLMDDYRGNTGNTTSNQTGDDAEQGNNPGTGDRAVLPLMLFAVVSGSILLTVRRKVR